MMKKIIKSFVIMLLVMILLASTVMGFTLQGWNDGNKGNLDGLGIYYVTNNRYGLFCTNHGYRFVSNRNYRVYERGLASALGDGEGGWLLSFIIGDMQRAVQNGEPINGVNSRNGQAWQEYIWQLIGTNKVNPNPAAFAELKAKYQEYKEVYNAMNNDITITAPNPDVVVANTDGMIGPFTVNYPYKEKVDEHIDLKITVTDSSTGSDKILFEKMDKNTTTNLLTSDAER